VEEQRSGHIHGEEDFIGRRREIQTEERSSSESILVKISKLGAIYHE
jgi:hypothetical protein